MIIETIAVSPFEQNCRILVDPQSNRCAVVDPGGDADRVLDAVARHKATVQSLWLTHSHLDHCGGVKRFFELCAQRSLPQPTLFGHSLEKFMRENVETQSSMFGVPGLFENCHEPNQYLDHVSEIEVGTVKFRVEHTPGHSPGHVVFFLSGLADKGVTLISFKSPRPEITHAPILISGDTLFQGSIGRTDLPGGNHGQLMLSIQDKILTMPPDTVVLAGHGPNTTIRREKATNPFLV